MIRSQIKIKRTPRKLILGQKYKVRMFNKEMDCLFIQPSPKGYNFLDTKTNRCVLNQSIYPSKCDNHKSGDWFFVNSIIEIIRSNDNIGKAKRFPKEDGGNHIWMESADGSNHIIADVRDVSELLIEKIKIDSDISDQTKRLQNNFSQFITDAINEKIERSTNDIPHKLQQIEMITDKAKYYW